MRDEEHIMNYAVHFIDMFKQIDQLQSKISLKIFIRNM